MVDYVAIRIGSDTIRVAADEENPSLHGLLVMTIVKHFNYRGAVALLVDATDLAADITKGTDSDPTYDEHLAELRAALAKFCKYTDPPEDELASN